MSAGPADAVARLAALTRRPATRADALALFDTLPAVDVPDLAGAWRGSGLPTGHPLDGLLELYGWHGKRFTGPDGAHPLVCSDARGLFSVDPAGLPLGLLLRRPGLARQPAVVALGRRLRRLRATRRPAARLRRVEFRGVATATMTYDALPINDHFRRVDAGTLLGCMDVRGGSEFFFVLRREFPGRPGVAAQEGRGAAPDAEPSV